MACEFKSILINSSNAEQMEDAGPVFFCDNQLEFHLEFSYTVKCRVDKWPCGGLLHVSVVIGNCSFMRITLDFLILYSCSAYVDNRVKSVGREERKEEV